VPVNFESLYEQAISAAQRQDYELAVELYDSAIDLDPSHADVYYKRGNALKSLGRLNAAVTSYTQAIDRKGDYAHAYCNLGVVQQALGLKSAALSSYDRSIVLDPADAVSHYNRALLNQELMQWEEALRSYDRAIDIDPQFADAQYNRAVTQLFCGDYTQGWRSFEWRWKNAQRLGIGEARDFSQPLWLGEHEIAGKRILLHCEGGLGDTLQFCRYAPLLATMGAIVYLEVQAPLREFLTQMKDVSRLIVKGEALPSFDFHCPLMSLPLAMKTTLESIPAAKSYLRADSDAVARWRARLNYSNRPRVGLVWSGSPDNAIDARRSINLSEWSHYLPSQCDYFCLQNHVRDTDVAVLSCNSAIRRFPPEEMDFASTAALCECMDVVVSVDTSLAHLGGALGRPTWILLSLVPDWRWLRDRDDSPWYPTAKLFRQRSAGNWREVFDQVAADLKRLG
jgi:tetratricopeptide (TPR) repeat protein